jgi:hypothetical protein
MDLIVDGHEGFLRELQLVLSLRLGGVVLFAPEGEFFVHGVDVVIDELNALPQRRSILADALDHALHQLQLLIRQVSASADYLLRRVLLLLPAQLPQTYLVLPLLLPLRLLLGHHFALRLRLDPLDVFRVFRLLLRSSLAGLDWLFLDDWWGRRNFLLLFSLLGCRRWLLSGLFDAGC